MKKIHDYSALKLEFFKSDFDEVKAFITDKWLIYNSERTKRTKWRTKEKQERKKNIVEKALMKQAEKQANELSVPIEDLMKWKKAVLQLLLVQVSKFVKANQDKKDINIDVWDAEKILKMFKTELWEPATIWANYNMNASKVEWLTDEESEALDVLFSTKIKKVNIFL